MNEIIAEKKNIEGINKFEFVGSIVHKFRPTDDVIVLTIAMNNKDKHGAQYPNISFYGKETADAIDENVHVKKGDYPRMRITGSIQTKRKIVDGKATYYQNFIGTSIAQVSTAMENISGLRGIGRRKAESQNDVCLLGEVTSVYQITREDRDRPLGVVVTMRVDAGHVNYPHFVCFGRMVPIATALEPGNVICVTGYAETKSKTRDDGKFVRLESIVATEIVVA